MTQAAVAERWPLVGRRPELARFADALADPDCDAFVVHGSAGVGKSRLAEECLRHAQRVGCPAGRALATAEARNVPLAAIAHLLPPGLEARSNGRDDPVGPVELFARAKRAFADHGDGGRYVLMVDDLHLLDVTSATLLRQLIATGTVFLVGAVLSGQRAATSVALLWRDDRCRRVDLEQLPQDKVETLLHQALGAPVDGPAAHSLWSTSGGNVLFLRELVLGAEHSGALVDEGGVWRLARPLTSTPRLNELVAARVAGVEEPGRRALELLALCGPLGVDAFVGVVGPETLELLEEAGLVTVTVDGRRSQLALAHPLHRAVLRDRMPLLRRRAILLNQVDTIERWGAHRREDRLRIASWRLEATGEADHDLLVEAARLAHHAHDYQLVVRLAGAAQAQRPSPETGVVLGRALYEVGSFERAEAELARAGALASDDGHLVAIAAVRAANLVWGLLRADEALAINGAALDAVTTPDARDELLSQRSWILVFSGMPAKARESSDSAPFPRSPRAQIVRTLADSYAATLAGFPGTGLDLARAGREDHERLEDQVWFDHPASHALAEVTALVEAGRLEEARSCAAAGYREASQEQVPLLQVRFASHCGRIALLSGLARTARRWYKEAVARSAAVGFLGPQTLALGGLAAAEAMMGDVGAAEVAILAMDALLGFGFLGFEREVGRAWWQAARGDVAEGRRVLLTAAGGAAATGHVTTASWLLFDVARLGKPSEVTERLAELAARTESNLISTRARHAGALAARDAEALEEVADRWEAMGSFLNAAEAASEASRVAARAGSARRSSALTVRAFSLAARCEGAKTPGLLDSEAIVVLTPREREVAALAASGLASRDIADRLFLSVRTVNNHLQRVYEKLGVSSRQELLATFERGEGQQNGAVRAWSQP